MCKHIFAKIIFFVKNIVSIDEFEKIFMLYHSSRNVELIFTNFRFGVPCSWTLRISNIDIKVMKM